MPNSVDYRKYLEERFNGIHSSMNAQFLTTHETLKAIEEQTKKTNGRVTDLEKWKSEHCGEETGVIKSIGEIRSKRNEVIKIVSLIVIALGLCLTAFSSLRNGRVIPEQITAIQDTLQHEVRMTKGIPNIRRGWLIINNNGLRDSVYLLKK